MPANKQEEYTKAFYKFHSLYQSWKIKHVKVPTTFVDPIRSKEIKFEKRKHCKLSLYKALKEKEVEK